MSAAEKQLVLLETEYFVTRVLYNVELLYSISRRKFVRPLQLDYPRVIYRVYPGTYIFFWGWWEAGRDHVLVKATPVKVREERGLEKNYEKWAYVKYKSVRDLMATPDVPQQFKDFARMTSRPVNPRLFMITYTEEEHQRLLRIIEERREFKTW